MIARRKTHIPMTQAEYIARRMDNQAYRTKTKRIEAAQAKAAPAKVSLAKVSLLEKAF